MDTKVGVQHSPEVVVCGYNSSQWKLGRLDLRRGADQRRLTQVKIKDKIDSFPLRDVERSKDACSYHIYPTLSW